eukprot:3991228-Amphidinium_carterae.1
MEVWGAGRLPPVKVTTCDLGVDTQWAAWCCPVQRKRVVPFQQAMMCVRAPGLPTLLQLLSSKARLLQRTFFGNSQADHLPNLGTP